jgi:hypothetical protein
VLKHTELCEDAYVGVCVGGGGGEVVELVQAF